MDVPSPRSPIVSSVSWTVKPGDLDSTIKAFSPSPSRRAKRITASSTGARDMNCFCPLMTKPLPLRRATVVTARGSEPVSDSVKPMPPSHSPFASGESNRRFCSSLPKRKMPSSGTVLTAMMAPTVMEAWQSCSSTRAKLT